METEATIEGFSVFSFLKGKNMRTLSKVELNAQLTQAWRSLSDEERNRYKAIASEFLSPTQSPQPPQSSLNSALTKALRQAKCSLTAFSKDLKRTRAKELPCPVNLPHEDILTCPICNHGFDQAAHSPICLPCGHTFCGLCISHMSTRGKLSCPMDRKETEQGGLRVNILMVQTLGEIVQGAVCRKHAAQVVAVQSTGRELLCGYCLASAPDAVLLDSQEGSTLAARHLATCCEKTNSCLQVLHYFYTSLRRFRLLTDRLALSLSLPSVKPLLKRLRKLTLALSMCAEEVQTLAMGSLHVMGSAEALCPWQRLVLEVPTVPRNCPRFEDFFEKCEKWIGEEENGQYIACT